MLLTAVLGWWASLAIGTAPSSPHDERSWKKPIVLDRSGGFVIGGKVISNPRFPSMTLHCDHGYMEYFIPWKPRNASLVMWHSSSTQTWQNRWDGGDGYKDKFLRRNYPVYLWDAPRLGRADWACEPNFYVPDYRDQGNFVAWNLGPSYKNFWNDTQFPTWDDEAWEQATASRYVEYDTVPNIHLQAQAAAVAADSRRIGENVVFLTNSAAGLRAQLAVAKSNTTNIKGIVAYESFGFVFPDTANITAGGPFGPIIVPLANFKKLAKVKEIQYVWGDHRDSFIYFQQAKLSAKYINMYGGNAKVLELGKDAGLKGSSHIAFMDMDNEKVAGLLDQYLERNGLDDYLDDDESDDDWEQEWDDSSHG
ncbi:hypothetical protein F5Y15DRAFT_123373 [Xylariaceae sp. FL0016]|nr:hypothetical protein F5Y15DRAFT_123373 [Xylariaceae sp. FL0016]